MSKQWLNQWTVNQVSFPLIFLRQISGIWQGILYNCLNAAERAPPDVGMFSVQAVKRLNAQG